MNAPQQALEFIEKHRLSMEGVDALLFLYRSRTASWSPAEAAAALMTSEETAATLLSTVRRTGIVDARGHVPRYRYVATPESDRLMLVLSSLEQHERHALEVIADRNGTMRVLDARPVGGAVRY